MTNSTENSKVENQSQIPNSSSLFEPLQVGDLKLSNRIFMAPLTRMRSTQPGDVPNELNAKYYGQRASAGLIISEATQISQQGKGYPATPGIYSEQQVEGWKLVCDEVHRQNGKILAQLWHVGRISHPSLQPNGDKPVAPSAIPAKNSGTHTAQWKPTPILEPRALETAEIPGIVSDFKKASQNAKIAGFDGVQIHAANGYLLDQFLQNGSNHRTDEYGGSIENRARLLLEAVDEAIKIWGSGLVSVRLSPYGTFNDMSDSDPMALFSKVLSELDLRKIAFVDIIEPRASNAGGGGADKSSDEVPSTSKLFRPFFNGVLVSSGGYNPQSAAESVAKKQVDAVCFGRYFISNPDLPHKIKHGTPLTAYNRATFYGGSEKGYTDY